MDYKYNKADRFADIGDGLQVHYNERGEGEAVVFLHGGGQGSGGWTNWKLNLDHFAKEGFRAIAPDAIGYGLSSKPEDAVYSIDFLSETLKRLLDTLGIDKVTLVGNSMGGATAIKFAQDNPGRMNKLVVMAPAGIGPIERYRDMPAIQMIFKLGQEGGAITKDKIARLLTELAYDDSLVDDQLLEERLEVALMQPPAVFKTLRIDDLSPRLPELKMPFFILWGRDDGACPVESGLEILKATENSKFLAFSKCGHWVQAEKADEFNKLCVDFLRS